MSILQWCDQSIIEQIAIKQLDGNVGIVYVDITFFHQLDERHGEKTFAQIINSAHSIICTIQRNNPKLFAQVKVEDDFFIYVQLETLANKNASLSLHEFTLKLKMELESQLNTQYKIEPKIELQLGNSLLFFHPEKDLTMIVYKAMKQAIRQVKHLTQYPEQSLRLNELQEIIQNQQIYSVYQPIISLMDGSVFGYEALTRGPEDTLFHSPIPLFDFAEKEGAIYSLDKIAREKAVLGCRNLLKEQKLFINIPIQIINDPNFTLDQTLKLLEQCGLRPHNIVFELTERSSIESFSSVKKTLSLYRSHGYQIAIDDAGAGYSSLQAIAELHPDYIKIDRSLIHGIHNNKIKENIVETFVTFARKMNILIIAEGIEEAEDLTKLIRMGVQYVQGFLLGIPMVELLGPTPQIAAQIQMQKNSNKNFYGTWRIGDLASPIRVFESHSPVSEVSEYFDENEKQLGVVIVMNQIPVGLIMREKLYHELSGPYGLSLFWNRSIAKISDKNPLIVDENLTVEAVSQMAMTRDINKLYDLVIITRNDNILGAASIQSILECITNVKAEDARASNPLTGLPGNSQIQRELNQRLIRKDKFSVIYADLDFFKWFNDYYGFQKGDQLLQYCADVIEQSVIACGHPNDFVGHIGGDDFIVITGAINSEILCQEIIRRFDSGVHVFYGNDHWTYVEDRQGNRIDCEGVTISLSLVVNECNSGGSSEQISNVSASLKKQAKLHKGSVYVTHII
mgnify:CR=1 FL=1